ncbi:hypothetical protein R6Q59_009294 [Mikania micrantha]
MWVTRGVPKQGTRHYNLSNAKKSKIMGYIKVTKAVPEMVVKAWSLNEWDYFSDQCRARGLEPDDLVVDDEDFLEDNVIEEDEFPPNQSSEKTCTTDPTEPEEHITMDISKPKKQAITKALKSSDRAVKATDMMSWSVGEWLFFKDQVNLLGLDMNYAVEDVDEEENCMSSFIAGNWKH